MTRRVDDHGRWPVVVSGQQSQQFMDRVQQLAQDSPYQVQPTDAGFDVTANIADEHWYALFNEQRLARSFSFHVSCEEQARRFAIDDEARATSSSLGLPTSLSFGVQRGTVHTRQRGRIYAWDQNFTPGEVVNYYFDSGEGRSLINRAAQECGWMSRRSTNTKIGIGFAIGGGAIAVLAIVIVVIILLIVR